MRPALREQELPHRTISIHAPQWGATRVIARGGRVRYFNPRTPVGCDHDEIIGFVAECQISIHAPQWGATPVLDPLQPVVGISIHAPQWGATDRDVHAGGASGISIHAPQWGATHARGRAHDHHGISIHAPQWGATWPQPPVCGFALHFNPRTPVGCDDKPRHTATRDNRFQSTHPSGVRRVAAHRNPVAGISIHAPQWGATRDRYGLWIAQYAFQSTHPSGVRPARTTTKRSCAAISIHAPQWGATRRRW